jgi:isoquinoline 1-oxidoreductase alpha subunit
MTTQLAINGKKYDFPADLKNIPLVEFLRDHLQLTGTKFGCGIGQCGACTVHIDGTAERACQTS